MKKPDSKTEGSLPGIFDKNIEKLKELFPEVFIEGKIDFDVLREILGDHIDDRPERYSFTWSGKSRARSIARMPSTGTLRPCIEESVNWNTTQNLFIEGDNLEVLKLLQKSYHKKVKMIYIDPPCNTGNEEKDHTNWLNMMLPRLILARNLLRDDGIIFISIDNDEIANLRKLCDEIFGEENFIAHIIRHKKYTGSNDAKLFSDNYEHILCYAYSKENVYEFLLYENGQKPLQQKSVSSEVKEKITPIAIWPYSEVGHNHEANNELKELKMGDLFNNPKPTRLIRRMCVLSDRNDRDGIILDFFAGSSATADAVLSQNSDDGGKRKFIMVQLPEPCNKKSKAYKAGYKTIADIGKERIRRVIKKIETGQQSEKGKLLVMETDITDPDIGFKVFKLDSGNIKPWDTNSENLEDSLFNAVENIKPDRSEADILYELLLKHGLDLTVSIKERKIESNTVYIIGGGSLIVCLADNISLGVVEHIAALKNKLKPETMRVIFRDSGFKDDVIKTNAIQILRQAGIDDVKSL